MAMTIIDGGMHNVDAAITDSPWISIRNAANYVNTSSELSTIDQLEVAGGSQAVFSGPVDITSLNAHDGANVVFTSRVNLSSIIEVQGGANVTFEGPLYVNNVFVPTSTALEHLFPGTVANGGAVNVMVNTPTCFIAGTRIKVRHQKSENHTGNTSGFVPVEELSDKMEALCVTTDASGNARVCWSPIRAVLVGTYTYDEADAQNLCPVSVGEASFTPDHEIGLPCPNNGVGGLIVTRNAPITAARNWVDVAFDVDMENVAWAHQDRDKYTTGDIIEHYHIVLDKPGLVVAYVGNLDVNYQDQVILAESYRSKPEGVPETFQFVNKDTRWNDALSSIKDVPSERTWKYTDDLSAHGFTRVDAPPAKPKRTISTLSEISLSNQFEVTDDVIYRLLPRGRRREGCNTFFTVDVGALIRPSDYGPTDDRRELALRVVESEGMVPLGVPSEDGWFMDKTTVMFEVTAKEGEIAYVVIELP